MAKKNHHAKFSKRITSYLIPFGYKEALDYFIEWFDYLGKEKEFLATLEVNKIPGVGEQSNKILEYHGIKYIRDINDPYNS